MVRKQRSDEQDRGEVFSLTKKHITAITFAITILTVLISVMTYAVTAGLDNERQDAEIHNLKLSQASTDKTTIAILENQAVTSEKITTIQRDVSEIKSDVKELVKNERYD